MSVDWEAFIDGLKDEAGKLAKNELKAFVSEAKNDSEEFIKRQGHKLDLYLGQLASGNISRDQFEGYIIDIRDLAEMQAMKMSIAGRARAQRLAEGITKLIFNGLLSLLK